MTERLGHPKVVFQLARQQWDRLTLDECDRRREKFHSVQARPQRRDRWQIKSRIRCTVRHRLNLRTVGVTVIDEKPRQVRFGSLIRYGRNLRTDYVLRVAAAKLYLEEAVEWTVSKAEKQRRIGSLSNRKISKHPGSFRFRRRPSSLREGWL